MKTMWLKLQQKSLCGLFLNLFTPFSSCTDCHITAWKSFEFAVCFALHRRSFRYLNCGSTKVEQRAAALAFTSTADKLPWTRLLIEHWSLPTCTVPLGGNALYEVTKCLGCPESTLPRFSSKCPEVLEQLWAESVDVSVSHVVPGAASCSEYRGESVQVINLNLLATWQQTLASTQRWINPRLHT